MAGATHEQVNLMLHLYELRREPRLREARDWFALNFHPKTAEDVQKIAPAGSRENASMRMVTSYWEMVASIANRGLLDEELLFENSGEQWMVWERLAPLASHWRTAMKNPHVWENLETHVKKLEAWREKRAPGTTEAMRQMMAQMMAAAKANAQPAASRAGAQGAGA